MHDGVLKFDHACHACGTLFHFAAFRAISRPFREILRPFRAVPLGHVLSNFAHSKVIKP